ncbi:MAG: hypothetical protein GF329_18535 [Candidatus Lokiarchaeota archaeon]|nr:hypothetical protein [Candidatus Lokiarchaeota archaeon]
MSEEKNRSREELKKISKGKGGSWVFGFVLMASGILILILGVMDLLNFNFIWNYISTVVPDGSEIANMIPVAGVTNFVIGIFAIIGGYGLIIDQEWAWGISMLILTYTAVQAVVYIATNFLPMITSPSDLLASSTFWVGLVVLIISVIGIIYLGITKYKYA